jgi:hypothetical protein
MWARRPQPRLNVLLKRVTGAGCLQSIVPHGCTLLTQVDCRTVSLHGAASGAACSRGGAPGRAMCCRHAGNVAPCSLNGYEGACDAKRRVHARAACDSLVSIACQHPSLSTLQPPSPVQAPRYSRSTRRGARPHTFGDAHDGVRGGRVGSRVASCRAWRVAAIQGFQLCVLASCHVAACHCAHTVCRSRSRMHGRWHGQCLSR